MRGGREVVLKLGWPHPEGVHEAGALRFFGGRGAVRLLDADEPFALLLERCRPGTDLSTMPPEAAHQIAASLLASLWRAPDSSVAFSTVGQTIERWSATFATERPQYPRGILAAAASVGNELLRSTSSVMVLHGDFRPRNVLYSAANGWLSIDPKPLIGDPNYDLAPYLVTRAQEAMASGDAVRWMRSLAVTLAGFLSLSPYRIAAWSFVRSVGWPWGAPIAHVFKTVADELRPHGH